VRIVAASLLRHTISGKNNFAMSIASMEAWEGMKCHIFESLSTTTQIRLNTSHSGNRTTKYIEISSHGFSVTGNVWRTANDEYRELRKR